MMEGYSQPDHQEIINHGRSGEIMTKSDQNVVSSEETLKKYTKVLEEVVNVNTMFTFAVFLGLSFASRNQNSLESRPECEAGVGAAKRLVVYEVLSFSLFIYSSLVAKSANFLLNFHRQEDLRIYNWLFRKWIRELIRKLIFDYSGWASVASFIFFLLSMVELVQIRLGKLSCGSTFSLGAAFSLILIFATALCIYAYFITYRVAQKTKEDLQKLTRKK